MGGTGRPSILNFYARRLRRILPAATLVILVTVAASYVLLGSVYGNNVADDGRWAAVFLSNFHFEAIGANYLTATRPPSPLQNYWSLSVEEQFYIVYPTLFLLIASLRVRRVSVQARLAAVLGAIIIASYWLSIVQTGSHPNVAYYSPFTRAWELALGALVAVATPWLKRIPSQVAAIASWFGLIAIVVAGFVFNAETPYPGSLVVVPVMGAGLIIAGGVVIPRFGVESVLALGPLRWVGRRSYSLYLWHWPILILVAAYAGKSLSYEENLVLVGLAVLISVPSYALIENPIRHLRIRPRSSVLIGLSVVIFTFAALSAVISWETGPLQNYVVHPAASTAVLFQQVGMATTIAKLPRDLEPKPSQVGSYWGGNFENQACQASAFQWKERVCIQGDPNAKRLMVVYGDSHALMWLPALQGIARSAHWKLVVLNKDYCPAGLVTIANQKTWPDPYGPDQVCDHWHRWAVSWIKANKPNLLVVTQASAYLAPTVNGGPARLIPSAQWSSGLSALLLAVRAPRMRTVVLGDIPALQVAGLTGPGCLSAHPENVQACTVPIQTAVSPLNQVEQSTAQANGAEYVDTVPWFCSRKCTAVISKYSPYFDAVHITSIWAIYLQNVLSQALGIPENSRGSVSVPPRV